MPAKRTKVNGWRFRLKCSVLSPASTDPRTGQPHGFFQRGEVMLLPHSNDAVRLWYPAPGDSVWTIEHLRCPQPPHGRIELVKSVTFYATEPAAYLRYNYWIDKVFSS